MSAAIYTTLSIAAVIVLCRNPPPPPPSYLTKVQVLLQNVEGRDQPNCRKGSGAAPPRLAQAVSYLM
jgi:hypothetical protein